MTKEQVRSKTKTVTRRLGWWTLRPGTILQPVEKAMGFKKGETIKKIGGFIRVISTQKEPLNAITKEDIVREGFPEMNRKEFMLFFGNGRHLYQGQNTLVNRIEFEYL